MLFQFDTPVNRLLNLAIMNGGGKLVEETVTGNPVSFETDVAKPLKGLLIPFTPVQSGTGDPSPDNVRPISGFTGINAVRCGVNLWDEEWESGNIDASTGQNIPGSDWRSKNYIPVVPGIQIYLYYELPNGKTIGTNIRAFYYDRNKTYIGDIWCGRQAYTVPANAYYMRFYGDSRFEAQNDHVSINFPSTETEYAPYSGETRQIVVPAVGKNLLKFPYHDASTTFADGFSWTVNADGTVTANGTTAAVRYFNFSTRDEPVMMKAGTYAVKGTGNASITFNVYKATREMLVSTKDDATFTLEADTEVYVYLRAASEATIDNLTIYPQIEAGSSATAYEPFTNTVFGGTLDALTGVLTVEWASKAIRWGDVKGTPGQSMTGGYIALEYETKVAGESGVTKEHECNTAVWTWAGESNTTPHFYVYRGSNGKCTAFVALPNGTDEDLNIVIVSKLKEPYTVQLDPVTLSTLIGTNALWTDTNGTNEITYMKKG